MSVTDDVTIAATGGGVSNMHTICTRSHFLAPFQRLVLRVQLHEHVLGALVSYLIVEYGEVESQAEPDGVCGLQL